MTAGHSVLAPSSAARTVQCPGSVQMERRYPETEPQPEALEGEASHWAAAEMLHGREVSIGDRAPNGVLLTQEMVEGADLYYDDVVSQLQVYGLRPEDGAIETPVAIPVVHPQCWGTPDFRVWVPSSLGRSRPLLLLWDYKFGHRPVEVFENYQLVEYVAGCLGQTKLSDSQVDVEVRIVQPRAYRSGGPVKSWTFSASSIRALVNIASNAAHEAMSDNPRTRVGPECRDCRARHACATLQRAALDACDVAGRAQPFDLSPAALGVELRMLLRAEALLKARIVGLEEQALATIRRGNPVPHFRIEHGLGRRTWSRPVPEVLALGGLLGVNLAQPIEPITPLQAVKAGIPESLLDEYTTRPRGAATLVLDDTSKARAVFGGTAV